MNGKAIGDKIKRLRTEQGLAQEKLAEMTMVNPQTIRKWEKGNVPYNWNCLQMLAKSLGTTADNILDGDSDMPGNG